jgi:oligoribonuclease NrnB/cAMP/cGMP phosphodiesterase (DHH superfamily)
MNKERNAALNRAKEELSKLQSFRQEAEEKLREAMTEKTKILADYRIEDLDSNALNEMLKKKLAYDPAHLSQIVEECKTKESEINRTIADIREEIAGEERAKYRKLFDSLISEIDSIVSEKIATAWVCAIKGGGISKASFDVQIIGRALSKENIAKAESKFPDLLPGK